MATTVPLEETRIIYHIDEEETPYLIKLNISPEKVTLGDFKNELNRPNYKFFFKSVDDDFGVVKEEIADDDALLPCFNGRVISWLVSAEGSVASEAPSHHAGSTANGASNNENDQVTPLPGERLAGIGDSRPPSFHHPSSQKGSGQQSNEDSDTLCDTCSELDSVCSTAQDRVAPLKSFNNYKSGPHRLAGRSIPARSGGDSTYDNGSSMMSSDVDTTSFFDSEDESSRFSTATGTTMSSARYAHRHKQQRRRRRPPAISRASSFSSITDSSMSLNIVTVTLNMDKVNFLGISIVGQSNKGADGGIYVGSIMKDGAVALDGRIEPGDMILEVNGVSFEEMTNDDAVGVLRDQVTKPGPITLVVAKCWNPNPKDYFTIPRQEPVRPIDPRAWVLHTNAMTSPCGGQGDSNAYHHQQMTAAPSMSTLLSGNTTLPAGASAAAFQVMQQSNSGHSQSSNNQHIFYHPNNHHGGLMNPHNTTGYSQSPNMNFNHQGAASVVTTSSSLPESDRYRESLHLTVNTDVLTVVRSMAQPDSGLEIRDRLWLKITLPSAFIGSDLVDWLFRHVEGFSDRRDARKYASNLLKLGYIRHTVNKVTFSEQCYYVFGDLLSAMSRLSLEELDSVSEADADRLAPLPPPNWGNTASTALTNRPAPIVGANASSGAPPPSYKSVISTDQPLISMGPNSAAPPTSNGSQYSSISGLYQQTRHGNNPGGSLSGSETSSSSSCSRDSCEKKALLSGGNTATTTSSLPQGGGCNPPTVQEGGNNFRITMGNTAM